MSVARSEADWSVGRRQRSESSEARLYTRRQERPWYAMRPQPAAAGHADRLPTLQASVCRTWTVRGSGPRAFEAGDGLVLLACPPRRRHGRWANVGPYLW